MDKIDFRTTNSHGEMVKDEIKSFTLQPDSFTISFKGSTESYYLDSDTYDGVSMGSGTSNIQNISVWHFWEDYYFPYVIKKDYPIWIQERAIDKGKKAYEIIKTLRDKKLITVRTVKQFTDLMDELIKVL